MLSPRARLGDANALVDDAVRELGTGADPGLPKHLTQGSNLCEDATTSPEVGLQGIARSARSAAAGAWPDLADVAASSHRVDRNPGFRPPRRSSSTPPGQR